jgi:hypothetical protein
MPAPGWQGSSRYLLRVAYDGARYAGWQKQAHARGVQAALEARARETRMRAAAARARRCRGAAQCLAARRRRVSQCAAMLTQRLPSAVPRRRRCNGSQARRLRWWALRARRVGARTALRTRASAPRS